MKNILVISITVVLIALAPTTQVFACAMTAVVGNGTTLLGHQNAYNAEAYWLRNTSGTNNDAWGACYYHSLGYTLHDYRLLPLDNVPGPTINDHYYRSANNIADSSYPTILDYSNWARLADGKILFAHARNQSTGEPSGAFAPFIYRSVADTVDYSFAHHGKVTKQSFINELSGFADFLAWYDGEYNTNYYTDPNLNVDSAYLFLWIMQNILENNGDVKIGLALALNATASQDSCQINIMLSDGSGIYAYTNHADNNYRMGYTVDTSNNGLSYIVRSWGSPVSSWSSYTTISPHHLYYFPAQGEIETIYNIDTSMPASHILKQGLNWISFPVLESDYGTNPNYTLQDVNPFANNMQTKNDTQLQPKWWIDDETYEWPSEAIITRTNGYILDIDSTYVEYHYQTYGQSTPYNTTLPLYQNNENWVPYFIQYSQTPANAFGNNYSHLTAIYAQDWYAYKFKGKWYGYVQSGATGTLDYGKMYKVYVDANITDFAWSALGQSQSFVKEATEYFEYEEQSEYQAIVIESILDSPVFDEIGVFKNGSCVGALKYNGYPVNLQVYDNSSPDEFEYVLYSASKNNGYQEKKYYSALIDVSNKVVENGKYKFSIIGLDGGYESESVVSPALSANIYPNPMRSNTIIEINASAKSAVEISIYNLKGQLVKTINSSEISKGNTTFVWNGRTDDGRPVAQGIYFCRIKSPNNLLTKKLVVLD